MKSTIIKNLKKQFGQDARISLKLVGTVRYPELGVTAPQYKAEVAGSLNGLIYFEELIVDTVQSRLGLEPGTVNCEEWGISDYFESCFEDEELPF